MAVPAAKSYTNGDVYIAVTKTWAKKPVPFLANIGWKATNATIFGIGGQSTRFGGRFFGGLGIPLPIGHGIVAVPSAGFTQEPRTVEGPGPHLPTGSLSWADKARPAHHPGLRGARDAEGASALRLRHRHRPGGGEYRNDPVADLLACPLPGGVYVPVDLQARKVVGMGISYRY